MRAPPAWQRSRSPLAADAVDAGLVGAYSYWESYYQHRGFATVACVRGARRASR